MIESVYIVAQWSVQRVVGKYACQGAALLLSDNSAAALADFRLRPETSLQVGSAYGQTLMQALTDKARLVGEVPSQDGPVEEARSVTEECLGLMQDQSLLVETIYLPARVEWRNENRTAAAAMPVKTHRLTENYCWLLLMQVSGFERQLYGAPVTQVEKYRQRLLIFTRD